MSIPPNTTFAHYSIISKLGAGGMGEVYLAQDSKLDRKVAIKFLNEEFGKDAEKLKRFVLEARSASALNHPNILTVYEIGETNGQNYIATELIDGKTLREQLQSKDSFSLNTILKVGVQVAEALSAAHQAGITHRDIKPENIMLRTDGYAKVLDFGLAKLSEPRKVGVATGSGSEDATQLRVNTAPGIVMGTVSYMSPEQARGNPTDTRSDLWSLGVVLYEMVARKLPFSGETVNHTIVAILEKEPRLLTTAPSELQRIIRKALTKDVDMRYQSARDLLIDLTNLRRDLDIQGELERSIVPSADAASAIHENETQVYAGDAIAATKSGQAGTTNVTASSSSLEYAVTQAKSHKLATALIFLALLAVVSTVGYFVFVSRAGSRTQINSIAVMPFINASSNVDVEYLSDGMTETLINTLSQLPGLSVKARSSVFRYKGKEVDPQTVGNELDVQAVLNGRVVQRGEDLTLYLSLVDTRTGNQIWGQQYNRKPADLLSLQTEVGHDVATKLRTRLSGAEEQKVAKNSTQNAEAYQLYLQGRYFWNKRTPETIKKSIEYFQKAIEKDPNYALGYAGLSDGYALLVYYHGATAEEAFPKAKEAALKALSLDEDLAESHNAYGFVLILSDYDYAGAEREYRRVIELNPNYALSRQNLGVMLNRIGRSEEGMVELRRALELEPLSIIINRLYGDVLLCAKRYDEALTQLRKTLELDPTFPTTYLSLSALYQLTGKYAESVESYAKYQDLSGKPQTAKSARESFAARGWQGYLKEMSGTGPEGVSPYTAATFLAQLGEKDQAFALLNKALGERDALLLYIKIDPRMDPLRSDPRFQELLRSMRFPE